MYDHSLKQTLLSALVVVITLTGCGAGLNQTVVPPTPTALPTAPPTPTPPPSIIGTLESWEGSAIAGRKIVLCQITDNQAHYPADCTLMPSVAISDDQGRFQFSDVPPGTYFLLYDSGYADFSTGLDRWAGQILKLGDPAWLVDNYFEFESDAVSIDITLFKGMPLNMNVVAYLTHSLALGRSPFILAHEMDETFSRKVFTPVFATVISDQPAQVEFEVR